MRETSATSDAPVVSVLSGSTAYFYAMAGGGLQRISMHQLDLLPKLICQPTRRRFLRIFDTLLPILHISSLESLKVARSDT